MSEMVQRKLPKQDRSRRRYEQILDSAAALFETQGIENTSTNHIAAAAGVAIGSLYQFFPNKEAIIEALVERYISEMRAIFPEEIDSSIPIEIFTYQVLGKFIEFKAQKSGFDRLLLDAEENSVKMHSILVRAVERVLTVYCPSLAPEKRYLCALVTIAITKGLMQLAAPPHFLSQEILLEEVYRSVMAYQTAFLQAEGLL